MLDCTTIECAEVKTTFVGNAMSIQEIVQGTLTNIEPFGPSNFSATLIIADEEQEVRECSPFVAGGA